MQLKIWPTPCSWVSFSNSLFLSHILLLKLLIHPPECLWKVHCQLRPISISVMIFLFSLALMRLDMWWRLVHVNVRALTLLLEMLERWTSLKQLISWQPFQPSLNSHFKHSDNMKLWFPNNSQSRLRVLSLHPPHLGAAAAASASFSFSYHFRYNIFQLRINQKIDEP